MPVPTSPSESLAPVPIATSYKVKLSHIFIFTFAVAFVYASQTAIAIRLSPDTYKQLIANMKPQIAVLAVADAMAKGFALCGLIAFTLHWRSFGKARSHPAEYFWLLLGCAVLVTIVSRYFPYAWSGGVYLIGGGILTWLIHETRWKCFYLLVGLSPFLISISLLSTSFTPQAQGAFAFALRDVVISVVLTICMIGAEPTMSAWGTVVSQLSLTAVSIYVFLLVFLDLWQ